jgi:hypothetical protein
MIERRRPVMQRWADYVTDKSGAKIISIGSRQKRP